MTGESRLWLAASPWVVSITEPRSVILAPSMVPAAARHMRDAGAAEDLRRGPADETGKNQCRPTVGLAEVTVCWVSWRSLHVLSVGASSQSWGAVQATAGLPRNEQAPGKTERLCPQPSIACPKPPICNSLRQF